MENSAADFANPTTLADMTTPPFAPASSPARWAPDPEVRGRLRYWDGARWTGHTVADSALRPDLSPSFRSATTWLYAGCGLTSAILLATFVTSVLTASSLIPDLTSLLMTAVTAMTFLTGVWAYVAAGSRRVDPGAIRRDRVWLVVAWFIPIIGMVFPPQLLGDTWSGARRKRIRSASDAASLGFARPRIIDAWGWVWAVASCGVLIFVLFGMEAFTNAVLALNALGMVLLAGVIRVIARELDADRAQAAPTTDR